MLDKIGYQQYIPGDSNSTVNKVSTTQTTTATKTTISKDLKDKMNALEIGLQNSINRLLGCRIEEIPAFIIQAEGNLKNYKSELEAYKNELGDEYQNYLGIFNKSKAEASNNALVKIDQLEDDPEQLVSLLTDVQNSNDENNIFSQIKTKLSKYDYNYITDLIEKRKIADEIDKVTGKPCAFLAKSIKGKSKEMLLLELEEAKHKHSANKSSATKENNSEGTEPDRFLNTRIQAMKLSSDLSTNARYLRSKLDLAGIFPFVFNFGN